LICACTPIWPNAPADKITKLDETHRVLLKDGVVTPEGYAVNTAYTVNAPHPRTITDPKQLVPQQTLPTIGDRLDGAGVSWAWYAGGWNDALAGNADKDFIYHHQPFAYFSKYSDGTPGRAAHLKDEADFLAAIKAETLPAVSFVKPMGPDNEHPGYAALQRGQEHVAALVGAVQNSSAWKDTVIIISYDENGGRWDHVAPPAIDEWGPGSRVPTILISPYAKRHFVDHTQYETVSILNFIERRWSLAPFGSRDAHADPMLNAFDFSQRP